MGKFSDNDNASIVYDDVIITVGTLAAATALLGAGKIDSARESGFRAMKVQWSISYQSKTDLEGPIMIGLAQGLSTAEIEECLAADPQGRPAIHGPENQAAKRPVWPLMMAPPDNAHGPSLQGRYHETKLNWSAPEGSSFSWFVYNSDANALTTGMKVFVSAKWFGVWLND